MSSSSSSTTTANTTYNNKYLAKNNANSNGPGAKPPGPGPGRLNWQQLISSNQTRLTKPLIASIVGLLLIYYGVVLNDVSLLTLAAHLVSLAQTAFLLFSLFTWLYLLATHLNLAPYLTSDHRLIYSGFLLAFVAEFLLQFVVFNCSTKSTTTTNVLVKEHSSSFFALVEWENLMFVGMLLTVTTIFLLFVVTPRNNYSQSSVYSRIVLVTVLTRIYGSFSFGTVLPQSICAYCAYTSAFAGLLFAHYINYILDCIHIVNSNANINSVNNSSPQITSISNEDMNNKKSASNSRRRSSLKEQRDKLQQQRKQRRNRRSDDEDEDTDECRDNCEQRCRFESLLEANRQQRSSQQQNRISVASFRRRTSLPTIKFDKSSASDLVNHHSVTTGSVAIVVREIKSRIDDLMSDVSTASPSSSSPTASSPTTSDPVATTITQQQQQQQTVNRLLSGLRTIRNIINRSALNQLVIADRQSRQQQQQQHQYKHSSSTSHSPQPNHQTTQQLSNKVMINNSTTVNAVKKSIEIVVNRLREDVSPSSAAASSNDASSHNDHEKTKIVYESNQEDYDPQDNDEDEDDDDRGIMMNNISNSHRHQVAAEDNDEYDNDDEDDEEEEEEDEDELERRRNSYSADEGVATSEDRAVRRRRRHNNNSQQQQSTAQSTPLQQPSAQPPTTSTSGRNRKSLPTQIYRRMFTQNTTSTSSTKSTTIRFDASSNSTNSSRQRSLSLKYSTNNSETPTAATATNKRLNNEPTNQKPNTSTTKRNSPTSGDQQQQQQQSLSTEREKASLVNYNESLPAEKSLKENYQTNLNTTADINAKPSSNNSNIMSSPSLQQQQQSSSSTPISQIQTSNSILSNKTSDYESGESPTNSDCNSDTDKLQIQRQQQQQQQQQQQHNNNRNNQSSGVEKSSTQNQYHTQLSLKRLDQIKEEFGKCTRNAQKYHHHDQLYSHFQQMSQQQQQQQTISNSPVTTTTTTSVTSCSASPSTTTNLTADGDDECCEDDEEDDMYIGACDVEDDIANNNYDEENGQKSVWQHPEDLEKNADLLNCLQDWNFPIFRFGERSKKFILSQMACKIFDEIGLFKAFDIQIDKFINFFTALESGYIDLPYHNRIHAADVLHACYYLTTQAVPNCMHTNKSVSHALMMLSENRKRTRLDPHQYALNYSLSGNTSTTSNSTNGGGENGYGCLGDNFTQLEILALYCSAAMHDYEHPGRNNAFLITISSPLAILYNDKSVLENHHASASWLLLKSNENFNFLSSLDPSEWKRLRFLVIENILATDLGRHFTIINEFNSKYNKSRPMGTCKETGILSSEGEKNIAYDFGKDESTANINWTNDSDRLLISQMILKLADINAPLKREELHVQWTYRIVEEFYQQGDEEMSLGLPMSPYMDRKQPQVAKLQESFINVLVGTLCDAYTFAGLLPGTLIDENEEGSSENSSPTESPTTSLPPSPLSPPAKPKLFQSEMINNLKSNYKMWCGKMKIEEEELAKKRASLTTEPS